MEQKIDETVPCPNCQSADENKTAEMDLIDKKNRKYRCRECGYILPQ